MDSQKIGKFIYELRTEKGLSQYKLADMIPISRQAISRWETGKAIPDSSTLLVLTKIFGVSTDELLLGRRITKDDSKLDIQSSITLSAVDDINKKSATVKKLRISIILSLLIFIIMFLGYYFINSYNSIKVFTINGETNNFTTKDGIFVVTRDKIYFRLGNFVNKENIEIDNFELYYLENDEEKKVFSSDTSNILIRDYYGYSEYFHYGNLNKIINNLYLRISFNDTYEDIHLVLKKDFANNNFLFFKDKKISLEDNNQDIPTSVSNNNIIKDFGKLNCDDDICTFDVEDGEHNITYTHIKGSSLLNVTDSGFTNVVEWNYFIDTGMIIYSVYENNEQIENITLNVDDISSDNKKYIQQFQSEYIIKHLH